MLLEYAGNLGEIPVLLLLQLLKKEKEQGFPAIRVSHPWISLGTHSPSLIPFCLPIQERRRGCCQTMECSARPLKSLSGIPTSHRRLEPAQLPIPHETIRR